MKQVAQNYRSGELTVLDVPPPGVQAGRGAGPLAVLADLHRHRDDEGGRGPALACSARRGRGPTRCARCSTPVAQQGPVATYKKVMNKLDSYTPLGYSLCGVVIEVGAGAEEFHVGQLVAAAGNEYALHAEYNWVPVNLCVPVPDGVQPEHAAFSTVGAIAMQGVRRGSEVQLGETRVRHRARPGRAARRAAAGRGRRPRRRDRHRRGPLPDGREGRRARVRRARRRRRSPRVEKALCWRRPTGSAPTTSCSPPAGTPTGRSSSRRGWPATGRRVVDIGKMPPRPAVERVLRQGARRPLLPLVRPGPLRRPLRARGHRLPGRLRPVDRAAQPRVLRRPDRAARQSTWSPLVAGTFPIDDGGRGLRRASPGALNGRRLPLRVPRTTAEAVRTLRRLQPAGVPARRLAGPGPAAASGSGFVGAGKLRVLDAAAAPGRRRQRRLARGGDDHVAVGGERPARFGFETVSTSADAVLDDERIDAVFVVTRHSSHADLACRALETRQGRLRREAAGAHAETRSSGSSRWSSRTGNDRLMVGFNRRFAPLLTDLRSRFGRPPAGPPATW